MSESHSSVKQGGTDLYRTPHPMIIPLRDTLSVFRNKSILDPCEGDGRIKNALRSRTNAVIGFDKYPDYGVSVDFLRYRKAHDIVASNPPFSLKAEFIDHALGLSQYVIFLLPMNCVNYNIIHTKYLDIPEFLGKLIMTPKLLLDENGSWKPGGITSYAWFFWKNGNKTRKSFEYYVDLRRYNR